MTDKKKTGLALLREPFPDNQIGKLAKGSKAQMTCDNKEKKNCNICGGWHHPKLIHLDFVGHAALTDRLLDADPEWYWEPLAYGPDGLPVFDKDGGLWIRLHVCERSMIGYGNAELSQYKEIGSRQKEVIGDALRNAAMRLGAALELWHKGDLHVDDGGGPEPPPAKKKPLPVNGKPEDSQFPRPVQLKIDGWIAAGVEAITIETKMGEWWVNNKAKIVKECTEAGAKIVYNKVIK